MGTKVVSKVFTKRKEKISSLNMDMDMDKQTTCRNVSEFKTQKIHAGSGYAEYNFIEDDICRNVQNIPIIVVNDETSLPQDIGFTFDPCHMQFPAVQDIPVGRLETILVDVKPVIGVFASTWDNGHCYNQNYAVKTAKQTTAQQLPQSNFIVTQELNRHPDSGQTFVLNGAQTHWFGMFLAPFNVNCRSAPLLRDIRFYIFDGRRGICIHPNTWHQPPIPLRKDSLVFTTIQNESHLCVDYNSLTHDRVLLGIDYNSI